MPPVDLPEAHPDSDAESENEEEGFCQLARVVVALAGPVVKDGTCSAPAVGKARLLRPDVKVSDVAEFHDQDTGFVEVPGCARHLQAYQKRAAQGCAVSHCDQLGTQLHGGIRYCEGCARTRRRPVMFALVTDPAGWLHY